MRKIFRFVSALSFILTLFAISQLSASTSTSADSGKVSIKSQDIYNYGKIPILFIENKKQLVDESVRYFVTGTRTSAFFMDTGVAFDIAVPYSNTNPVSNTSKSQNDAARHIKLKVDFAGASPKCRVQGIDKAQGKTNVISGSDPAKWKTNISLYKGIVYKNTWKGIDISYTGIKNQLKYDIIVNPGAKVSDIKLQYKGVDKLFIDKKGDLHIKTAVSSFTETVPGIHQTKSGRQTGLKGGYVLLDKQTVGFKVQGADPRLPIVIDPASDLVYSTFLGAAGSKQPSDITVDSAGCAYITGYVYGANFPTTEGAYDRTGEEGSCKDGFVVKLNESGTDIIYSTYLQGWNTDDPTGICVDNEGCAYVAGGTGSSNYPVTPGAFSSSNPRGFITKLNPDGSGLVYSTFFPGSICGITLDSNGCVYLTGYTTLSDFPTTPGAFDTTFLSYKGFVSKLNPMGTGLVYSTFLGGSSSYEQPKSINIDSDNCAYVTGYTYSTDFPVTAGAYDNSYNGGSYDGFVTKLNSTGTALVYSTFIGGSEGDEPVEIVIDDDHYAYITGDTYSRDFPTTPDAFDKLYTNGVYSNDSNVFVAKLDSAGSSLEYSTYFSGRKSTGIAVDDDNCAYIVGYTSSPDFPTTPDAFDDSYNDFNSTYSDAFLTKFNSSGSGLVYSTLLGGLQSDSARGICLGADGYAYITGNGSYYFPTTPGAYDESVDYGYGDIFIAKMNLDRDVPKPDIYGKVSTDAAYTGMNVYEETPDTQVCSRTANMSQTTIYRVRVENDSSKSGIMTLKGDPGSSGWKVAYKDVNNRDLTSTVTAGTFETPELAIGESFLLLVYVTPQTNITVRSSRIELAASTKTTPAVVDSMEFATTCNWAKPDIYGKPNSAAVYTGMNVYEASPINQVCSQDANISQTAVYRLRIENDASVKDIFKIKGTAGSSGWKVVYKDVSNRDLTSQITAGTYETQELAGGASTVIMVYITPQPGIKAESINVELTASSKTAASIVDSMALTTSCPWAKPDIYGKASTAATYTGMNVYLPTAQSCSQTVDVGQNALYRIRVENDAFISVQ